MSDRSDTIVVRANVEMTTQALDAIVRNAKQRGAASVGDGPDLADWVGVMVSRFILKNDFQSFVEDAENYYPS